MDHLVRWATDRLTELDRPATGPAQTVRAMPWASVVRVPTVAGAVWAKSAVPAFRAEMRLLPLLARERPDDVPRLLAVDAEQGLLLMADAGSPVDGTQAWRSVLQRYARVQAAMAAHVPQLLDLGLPDLRPQAAATALAQLVARDDLLVVGGPYGLDAAEGAAVRALVPQFRRVADRLDELVSASPVTATRPASVQHDDLQPANLLDSGRVIDWGDASVAHPFASLLTVLTGSAPRPGVPADRSRVRDAYLTAYAAGPHDRLEQDVLDDLREQARLACLVAPAGRILAWLRVPEALGLYPDAVTTWWRRILAMDWSLHDGTDGRGG